MCIFMTVGGIKVRVIANIRISLGGGGGGGGCGGGGDMY